MDTLWKVEDCAKVTRLAPATIYSLVHQKRIPHVKLGHALRFRAEDIQSWIESQLRKPEKVGKDFLIINKKREEKTDG